MSQDFEVMLRQCFENANEKIKVETDILSSEEEILSLKKRITDLKLKKSNLEDSLFQEQKNLKKIIDEDIELINCEFEDPNFQIWWEDFRTSIYDGVKKSPKPFKATFEHGQKAATKIAETIDEEAKEFVDFVKKEYGGDLEEEATEFVDFITKEFGGDLENFSTFMNYLHFCNQSKK